LSIGVQATELISRSEDQSDTHVTATLDHSALVVDRSSPIPLYFQIQELFEQEILGGRAAAGMRLAAEPNLAQHFGVSRSVIRQALARLEESGLVSRRRGQGSFIADDHHRSWRIEGRAGFFEDELYRLGKRVVSRIIRCESTSLPSWACDALELPPSSVGVVLERLRYVDGVLSVYDLNYLPSRFASVLDLAVNEQGSLYSLLARDYGIHVEAGSRVIDAVIAGERLAKLLDVSPSAALLVVAGIDLDATGEPFDCYRTWVRPDRMKLEVAVHSGDSEAATAA